MYVATSSLREASQEEVRRLRILTGISDIPEDDLLALEEARMTGTCEWFTRKSEFDEWRTHRSGTSSILWLSGNPTSGKSIIASHVVRSILEQKLQCNYFFFKRDVSTKAFVADCLRSIVYQMALFHQEIRSKLLQLESEGCTFEKNDERAIWRKLFLGAVFQAKLTRSNYWVIDALDECKSPQSLLSLFANIDHPSLQIFVTSRRIQDIERGFGQFKQKVIHVDMQVSDTLNDIESFVLSRNDRLPVEGDASRAKLTKSIIEKSNGSFLWVHLVMQELEYTWSEEGVEEVLNETPADMNLFYTRLLENMSKTGRATKLAKAILTWTVCSSRLLTVTELQCALRLDINETVPNLGSSVASICGQLVFVDHRSRVQMIHQTARDFLLQENLESPFAVRREEGHAHLAVKCLEFLSGEQSRVPRSQWQKHELDTKLGSTWELALTDYASTHFSDHLYKCSSLHSEPWDALYTFLNSNVLQWIEELARKGDLESITQTAVNIKAYLERRAKYFAPIGQQFRVVQAWVVDLIRVTAKFRPQLLMSPPSIHNLIPPFCPTESIIAQIFSSPHRGLIVKGLRAAKWDDCLTQMNYDGAQAEAINHGDQYFAVGLSTGQVKVYRGMYGQIHLILQHSERVKILKFGHEDKILASSGLRNLIIWDLKTGNQIGSFVLTHRPLALAFSLNNGDLFAATQGNYVECWSLIDGSKKPQIEWNDGFNIGPGRTRRHLPPTHASIAPDHRHLAVAYRGYPILLFDLESQNFFGNCVRSGGLDAGKAENNQPIDALTFNPGQSTNVLIVSYADGELTVYNTRTAELKHRIPKVFAQTLACSPDGRTVVTGSAFGVIQIFEVDGTSGETLSPMYHINAGEEGIWSLIFSSDNLRFIDIHGSKCRIWEPEVLVRRDLHDGDQSELSDPVPLSQVSIKMVSTNSDNEIASMICLESGERVLCGRYDGTVAAYSTLDGQISSILYNHSTCGVTVMALREKYNILASADDSSTVVLCKMRSDGDSLACDILTRKRFGYPVRVLLINATADRLLVGGEDFYELWTPEGEKVSSKSFQAERYRHVIAHPSQSNAFIVFDSSEARIFLWADFEEQTSFDGIKLNRLGDPLAEFGSAVSYHGESVLAELRTTSGYKSSSQFECWKTCNFEPSSKVVNSLPGFNLLGSSIKHIIAVVETTMLFVNVDLWICSLDLLEFGATPQFKRHFFVPTDWPSAYGDMLFQVTSQNEFVFARKDELVIIKGGLDYAKTISLSREVQAVINDRQPVVSTGFME